MMRRWPGVTLVTALAMAGSGAAAELPRLAGTVIGPAGSAATIELGTRQIGVAPGERVDGWMVTSIAPGHVVLSGPDGPVNLRLTAAVAAPVELPPPAPAWSNPCGRRHVAAERQNRPGCRAATVASLVTPSGQDPLGKALGGR